MLAWGRYWHLKIMANCTSERTFSNERLLLFILAQVGKAMTAIANLAMQVEACPLCYYQAKNHCLHGG